jgi:ribonuclease HI
VTASVNPWSQVYKLAAGKTLNKNTITTLTKPDGSETRNTKETIEVLLDHLFEKDNTQENLYQKQIRKTVEEPIETKDDIEFSREEIKQVIESFKEKKAPGIDGITVGIYLRVFKTFPNLITTIYNQCLKRGCFPQKWKVAQIIPIIKPGKENSTDPAKYRPISLLNIGGKVLEKLVSNRINYHLYKNKLMTNKQFGFTPQKNTIDAIMEVKRFIEPVLERRGVVIMTSLDVKGAFDAASWTSILYGLKKLKCPRNLYNISKGYFSNRTAILTMNNISETRRITKGCPQGSCSAPMYWNVLYNSLLELKLTNHSQAIAFADDLIVLTKGDTVVEAENYMNIEMKKIMEWATNNSLTFNETKSRTMLVSRRRRKREKKEIEIYVNNTIIKQEQTIKYLGIIIDSKLTFRDHINYIEEKCLKLIFSLSRSAKITWGLKQEALKTIYTGGILPLMLYGAPVWNSVLKRQCYKAKLIRIQRLINLRMAKAYRTVSNEALCIINGITPINIKIAEIGKLYDITKGGKYQYDREMEKENWNHPALQVNIIERNADSPHYIQAYTDGSKSEDGVGAGIAIYQDNTLTSTLKYRLSKRCTNNQAEQVAILKALEHIQSIETGDKTACIHTDSQITLQLLKNKKKTHKTYRTYKNNSNRNGTEQMDSRLHMDKSPCGTPRK